MHLVDRLVSVHDGGRQPLVDDNAEAKVCQDVVLKAISESSLSRNVTIKGGVVMRSISDDTGDSIESKIDLGVHKHLDVEQEEYCFDIACYDGSATLLINSKEQMFTEKLRSLLKFGPNSTRYKDIFDMFYLTSKLDSQKLLQCLDEFIISDPGMKENGFKIYWFMMSYHMFV